MNAHDRFDGPWWRYPILRMGLLAGAITGAAFALAHTGLIGARTEVLLYLVAIPLGAYHWAREAIEDLLREREAGIDLLMLAAAAGSGALGLWDEAAFLCFLYAVAEGIEEYTYARTRSAIRALLELAPEEARRLKDGVEEVIPAVDLEPGDRFLVRPGESIATDGIVRRGTSSVNEAAITGESMPVEKAPGAHVFAGTLNEAGALEIEASAAFADNTLSKIIHLVETAQAQKGKAQQWIERFGRVYSPGVLATAALLVLGALASGLPIGPWAHRAVVLLVAAAPCALVMSMPIAMAAGISRAGRSGILIKGGAHLEHLGSVATIAFDKTGTLTAGHPSLSELIPCGMPPDEILRHAAAVERLSAHPLARSIVRAAEQRGLPVPAAEDFESLTGAGATAVVAGERWWVASPSYCEQQGLDLAPLRARIAELEDSGHTVVLAVKDRRIAGAIALRDEIRPEAARALADLAALRLRLVMLTGDNARTAAAVARSVGLEEVRAGLRPEGKVQAIHELVKETLGGVLMVGDGVNDAPALAASTCGVAMGAAGSDAAIEAADVALMADDLLKLPEALELGRRARRVSRQNIVFSILVLLVLVPAALSNAISVAVAVVAHELSELIAVANGLRAGRG